MGTNYYARIGPERCEACGREFGLIHLGKASAGWVFGFRWQPKHYQNFPDFRQFVRREEVHVHDESGAEQDKETFLAMIEAKQAGPGRRANHPDFATWPKATPIHVIDGYEFCDYEFS